MENFSARLLDLYRGPFLAADADEAWQLERRKRMRGRFVRAMTGIGRCWQESGQGDWALECYEKCLEADPLAEGFYPPSKLMLCYQRLERRAEAIETFNRCRKALSVLTVEPSAETRVLYDKLIAAR